MICPACSCPGAALLMYVHCLSKKCRLYSKVERERWDWCVNSLTDFAWAFNRDAARWVFEELLEREKEP